MTVELSNGTLWTLIRTNAGGGETMAMSTLWEAFSDDGGRHWRGPPRPSSLISWSSPAVVLRLDRSALWQQSDTHPGARAVCYTLETRTNVPHYVASGMFLVSTLRVKAYCFLHRFVGF